MESKSTDPRIHFVFNEFLAKRFDEKHSLNAVFAFRSRIEIDGEFEACNQDTVRRTLRLLHNKLNQFAFGNAARRKRSGRLTERSNAKELAFTAALHTRPHYHVHCQIEIPLGCKQSDFEHFIRDFAIKNRWITSTDLYIENTRSNIATQKYNSRYGPDTIILF